MALKVQEWIDPLSQDPKGLACWFCKEHPATVAFWENNPSGYDISHGMRPRPSCAHCCNIRGLEYAKAMIAQQQARIPLIEAELEKGCSEMEIH